MKRNYALKSLLKTRYTRREFLSDKDELLSPHDLSPWIIGEWRKQPGELEPCVNGLHFLEEDGVAWIDSGEVICVVQLRGERKRTTDSAPWRKGVAREMRIVKVLDVTEEDIIEILNSFGETGKEYYPTLLGLYYLAGDFPERSPEIVRQLLARLAPEYL